MIGVMPGGGGGTDTGRLPGPTVDRPRLGSPAAAAGAAGGGVTGRGASGGGIIGSGATGGLVNGYGVTAAVPAAGSGRLRRPRRVPVSDGWRAWRLGTGSGARRAPAARRPLPAGW